MATEGFKLGPWTVHPKLNRLCGADGDQVLEPRLMRVLEILAEKNGDVVSREQLLERVWGDVVVGEETLTVAISQLRRHLGDDARSPRFIETIRKGGYRLVAQIETLPRTPAQQWPPTATSSHRRRAWCAVSAVLVAGVLAGGAAWLVTRRAVPVADQQHMLDPLPLTSTPGSERFPALAPDGTRVAYCWNDDIFVTQRGAGEPLRMTTHPAPEAYPAWSPDGSQLAFVRMEPDSVTIQTMPSLGGSARELVSVEPLVAGLDWSPNGRWLAISASTDPELPYLISLIDLENGTVVPLTRPQKQFACDAWPRFSPDSSHVAFVRSGWGVQNELFVIPTSGTGGARRLADRKGIIQGLDWFDNHNLVISASRSGFPRLECVDALSGTTSRLPLATGEAMTHPTFANGYLVFESARLDTDIWEIPFNPRIQPRALLDSTRLDTGAVVAPDGRQVAFVSQRTGRSNLWLCGRDGSYPLILTDIADGWITGPGWSPDGSRIAFTLIEEGASTVCTIARSGGRLQRLQEAGNSLSEVFSVWAADAGWLYFGRGQANTWQLWRMRSDGSGRELVADDGVRALVDTGEVLVYLRSSGPSLWQRKLDGNHELLVDHDVVGTWLAFSATRQAVYAITIDKPHRLQRMDLSGGSLVDLRPVPFIGRFTPVPDDSSILIERDTKPEHDLMMVSVPSP